MAQITLNSSGVASNGALALQSNGTTTAVTIDTSQNVLVGAASAAAGKLVVKDTSSSNHVWLVGRTSDGASSVSFRNAADSAYNARLEAVSGYLAIETNGSEKARITSAGNLGVGVTPADTFTFGKAMDIGSTSGSFYYCRDTDATNGVGGIGMSGTTLYIVNKAAGDVRFYINDDSSERARITSDGRLLVGLSSPRDTEKFAVSGSATNFLAEFQNTASSGNPNLILALFPNFAPNQAGTDFFRGADSVTTRFSLRTNGGLANYSANDANLSDRREKTNFAPATSYLDKICAIPVQTFNYIDQNMEEDGGLTLGVVAQDVQAVAPELVMESNWSNKDEEPKMRLSIYQTDLQYALMKALQELNAKFEAYKASHP
jgi:hypothetical protein